MFIIFKLNLGPVLTNELVCMDPEPNSYLGRTFTYSHFPIHIPPKVTVHCIGCSFLMRQVSKFWHQAAHIFPCSTVANVEEILGLLQEFRMTLFKKFFVVGIFHDLPRIPEPDIFIIGIFTWFRFTEFGKIMRELRSEITVAIAVHTTEPAAAHFTKALHVLQQGQELVCPALLHLAVDIEFNYLFQSKFTRV